MSAESEHGGLPYKVKCNSCQRQYTKGLTAELKNPKQLIYGVTVVMGGKFTKLLKF